MGRLFWVACVGAVVGCGSGGERPSEVAALRTQLDALEARVEALEAEHAAPPLPGDAAADGRGPEAGIVTWTFQVIPGGADITVDGELVEDLRWFGYGDGTTHRVRIRRAGFRIVDQAVVADRDRHLRYSLRPGRGVQQLPSPR